MPKVLITGATGFIGNHVTRLCLEKAQFSEALVTERRFGIKPDRLLKVNGRLPDVLRRETLGMKHTLQEGFVGIGIHRLRGREVLSLLPGQRHPHLPCNFLRHPALQQHDVLEFVLERGRPDVLIQLRIEQLYRDAHTVPQPQHGALDNPRDAEFSADLPRAA